MTARGRVDVIYGNPVGPNGYVILRRHFGPSVYERRVEASDALTVYEAARVMDVTRAYVYQLINDGRLPTVARAATTMVQLREVWKLKPAPRPFPQVAERGSSRGRTDKGGSGGRRGGASQGSQRRPRARP